MKPFTLLSPPIRNLFQLWALIICFAAIVCIIYALWQKQHRYALYAMPCFAVVYLLRQIMLEILSFCLGNTADAFCLRCGKIPWLWYAAAMILLTADSAWILYQSIRYNRSNVTPDSIRLCADSMPCGICYWRDGGRVIFANECMTELCFSLTGYTLQNGEELNNAVTEPILIIEDKVWSFKGRTVCYKGAPLHELIAADVTELYEKTQALKVENEEIARYNETLRTYYMHIDETVRQQEILDAKANIHDEMNRLMLTTIAAGGEDGGSVDDAFALWQSNALLLCREAAEDSGGSVGELERIAKVLKISLVWHRDILETLTDKQRSLFFSAAQEAIANAFKHAEAKVLEIDFIQTSSGIRCDFSNRGRLPEGKISFTGGLGNLKSLAKMQSAEVSVTVSECFTLSLFFPEKFKIRCLADVQAENSGWTM